MKRLITILAIVFIAGCTVIMLNKKSKIEVVPETKFEQDLKLLNDMDTVQRLHPLMKHDYDTTTKE